MYNELAGFHTLRTCVSEEFLLYSLAICNLRNPLMQAMFGLLSLWSQAINSVSSPHLTHNYAYDCCDILKLF